VDVKTCNLEEFKKEAERFIRELAPAPDGATVVGLYGNLGAGKTTFVQAAAKALGISETVNSPTFLIQKRYPVNSLETPGSHGAGTLKVRDFETLVHIDAYRLKHSRELQALRFEELLKDPRNLILVEWADKVADILPKDHIKIFFEFVDERTRTLRFT